MNVERLNHLISILEKIKTPTFNMNDWISYDECGTVCCALGWAAFDQSFQEQGLEIQVRDSEDRLKTIHTLNDYNQAIADGFDYDIYIFFTENGIKDSFQIAGARFFDITIEQSEYIFFPIYYPRVEITPKEVIRHIRNVIDGKV